MFQREEEEREEEREMKSFPQCLLFTGMEIFNIVVIFTLMMNISSLQKCELILKVKSKTQHKFLNTY